MIHEGHHPFSTKNGIDPRLIATEDNIQAVRLAMQLLTYGEPIEDRVGAEDTARAYLDHNARYLAPLATVQERGRKRVMLTGEEFEPLMHALMGRIPL